MKEKQTIELEWLYKAAALRAIDEIGKVELKRFLARLKRDYSIKYGWDKTAKWYFITLSGSKKKIFADLLNKEFLVIETEIRGVDSDL